MAGSLNGAQLLFVSYSTTQFQSWANGSSGSVHKLDREARGWASGQLKMLQSLDILFNRQLLRESEVKQSCYVCLESGSMACVPNKRQVRVNLLAVGVRPYFLDMHHPRSLLLDEMP